MDQKDQKDQKPMSDLVEIGYVARAHGTRGDVFVTIHNPNSSTLELATSIFIGDQSFAIETLKLGNGGYRIGLDSIGDRDHAEQLRGKPVSVTRSELGLAPDEVLLVDLIGCQVVLKNGEPWGKVIRVEPGAQDRLVILDDGDGSGGGIERELPLVDAFVLSTDLEQRVITVDPPPDLPESRANVSRNRRGISKRH